MVFIQSGDRVPADLRLYQLRELKVDESMLTGESLAVRKQTEQVPEEAALGDRLCMAYAGTLVTAGQGLGVVASTGEQTEIGRISTLLEEVETLTTPLTRQMSQFAGTLTLAILAVAAVTAVFGVAVRGYSLEEMFLAAVGLAVAAIPEGLPAIITIALAIGVQRMAAQRAIIRRLPAVETLGSVSTICSDKTGTLTRNEMTVRTLVTVEAVLTVSGVGYDPHGSFLLEVDNSPLMSGRGHPRIVSRSHPVQRLGIAPGRRAVAGRGRSDGGALIVLGAKAGLRPTELGERFPRIDVLPFESQHRFMATLHHDHDGNHFVFVKGAAEVLLHAAAGSLRRMANVRSIRLTGSNSWSASPPKGQRTLALASRSATPDTSGCVFPAIDELCLLGIVGITGTRHGPRQSLRSPNAVRRHPGQDDHRRPRRNGVQPLPGSSGIGEGQPAMSGIDLDRLDDATLRRQVLEVDVFARASRTQAAPGRGDTGQWRSPGNDRRRVNDAPALKRADVGVAMGVNGTEAAKQAAEMVLADDNFAIDHARGARGPQRLRQHQEIDRVHPADQRRRSADHPGRDRARAHAAGNGCADPLGQHDHRRHSGAGAGLRTCRIGHHAPAATRPAEPLLSRFMIWRVLFVVADGRRHVRAVHLGADARRRYRDSTHRGGQCPGRRRDLYLFNVRFLFAPALNRAGLFGSRYALIAVALVSFFQILYTYLPFMQQVFSTRGLDAAPGCASLRSGPSCLWRSRPKMGAARDGAQARSVLTRMVHAPQVPCGLNGAMPAARRGSFHQMLQLRRKPVPCRHAVPVLRLTCVQTKRSILVEDHGRLIARRLAN